MKRCLIRWSEWMPAALAVACAAAFVPDARAQDAVRPPAELVASGLFEPRPDGQAGRHTLDWQAVQQRVDPGAEAEAVEAAPASPTGAGLAALLADSDEAVEQGAYFRAIQLLREAEQISPGHPALQRRFGVAYTLSGNRVRGAVYLEQALQRDPDDAGVLVLLSQYAALRGPLDAALRRCAALSRAGQPALADLYRSEALARHGYTAASADRLAATLDAPADQADADAPDPIVARELRVLRTLEPELRQRLGDLLLSLDAPGDAADQYARIDLARAADPGAVVARRAYLALLAGDQGAATEAVVTLLRSDADTVGHARLIGYLSDQGVPSESLVARLQAVIDEHGASMPLLAGLAQVAAKRRAVQAIASWLADRPGNPAVLRQASSLVRFSDHDPADAEPLAEMLLLAAGQMRREPAQAGRFAKAVLGEVDALVCLLRALRLPMLADSDEPAAALLVAMGYEHAGRTADAIAGYRRAFALDPSLEASFELTLARLLIEAGRPEQAVAILDRPGFAGQWDAFVLRVDAAASGVEAGELIDAWEREQGEDLRSRLLRIRMTARWGRPRDACQSMMRLVNDNPTDLRLYNDAIAMVSEHFERFDDAATAYAYSDRFTSLLILNLPESLPARVEQAIRLYGEVGREQEMHTLLDGVLDEQPAHSRALSLKMLLLQEAGDQDAADAVYERLLRAGPPGLVRAMARAVRSIERGDHAAASDTLQRMLALDEQGVLPGRAMTGDDAAHVLQLLASADPDTDHEPVSLRMVRRFPDNPTLNNALGYRWAMRGENLRQAKAMIERALDVGGENHAVLDSMAWVQYKLGDFAQAEAYQRRAIELLREEQLRSRTQLYSAKAVLYDHMGDIMYRQDDAASATRHWQIALSQVPRLLPEDLVTEPELATVGERLEAKLAAVREGNEPPVEPVPGPEAHGPAAHPADLPAQDPNPATDPGQDPAAR